MQRIDTALERADQARQDYRDEVHESLADALGSLALDVFAKHPQVGCIGLCYTPDPDAYLYEESAYIRTCAWGPLDTLERMNANRMNPHSAWAKTELESVTQVDVSMIQLLGGRVSSLPGMASAELLAFLNRHESAIVGALGTQSVYLIRETGGVRVAIR